MQHWHLEPRGDEALLAQYMHGVVNILTYRRAGWSRADVLPVFDVFSTYRTLLNTRARLLMFAHGSIDAEVYREVDQRSWHSLVLMRGPVNEAEERAFLLMAHACLLIRPTIEDLDITVRARAMRIPVAAAEVPGDRCLPDILVWDASDPRLLAQSIHRLLLRPDCVERLDNPNLPPHPCRPYAGIVRRPKSRMHS